MAQRFDRCHDAHRRGVPGESALAGRQQPKVLGPIAHEVDDPNTTAAAPADHQGGGATRSATSDASTGKNTSCPVAFAADRMPSTRPRRLSNQRLAMMAASTIDVTPVPVPTSTPQSRVNCHWVCMRVNATDTAKRHGAEDDPTKPPAVHDRRGKRTDQPEQCDVDCNRCRDGRCGSIQTRLRARSRTPGVARTPAVTRRTPNVTSATIHA